MFDGIGIGIAWPGFGYGGAVAAPSLPTLSVGAPLAVYGMRRMVSGYNGALFRLTNATSTPTTLDISATSSSNNAPDLSGYTAWINGAAYAKIDIIYDQTGGGNHATQTTDAARPIFVNSGFIRSTPGMTFDGNIATFYMTIPAAVTGSGRAVTDIHISAYQSTNAAVPGEIGALWNTAGSITNLVGSTHSNTMQMLTSTTFVSSTLVGKGRSQPQLVMIACGASNSVIYEDENTATIAANNAGTWVGGKIGKSDSAAANCLNGELYARIIYNAQISSGDAALLKTFLYSEFDILTSFTAQLVLQGNSIVQGTKATLNQNNLRQAEPSFSRRIFVSNQGVFGETVATQHTGVANRNAQYNAGLSKNLMCVGEPTNDIGLASSGSIVGVGTAAWTNSVLPDIQTYIAAGWKVLVPTILPRVWSGTTTDQSQRETERTTYNGLVASNQATYGYTILDYASIPNMSNPSNLTYYADGTHPTTVGYGLMAALLATGVNSLI